MREFSILRLSTGLLITGSTLMFTSAWAAPQPSAKPSVPGESAHTLAAMSTKIASEIPAHDAHVGVVMLPKEPLVKPVETQALWRGVVDGDATLNFNDNLYKAGSSKTSDLFAILAPRARLISDFDHHALNVSAGLEAQRYLKEHDNDIVDGDLKAQLRLDTSESTALNLTASHALDHINIGSFDDAPSERTLEPTRYSDSNLAASFTAKPDFGIVELGADAHKLDYDNVQRIDGTTAINDDRDRTTLNPYLKVGLQQDEGALTYLRADVETINYDTQTDSTALHGRDANEYGLSLGFAEGEITAPRMFDIRVGYITRSFDDNFYDDISTIGINAQGRYQFDPHWKLTGALTRSIEESTLAATSAYIQSRVQTKLAYRMTQEVELNAKARVTLNEFQQGIGTTLDRQDKIFDGGFGGSYYLTKGTRLDLDLLHTKRTSDDATAEYDANQITLGINVAM